MRHGLKIKKIGRNASHRKATLQSMSISLIEHKRITTTLGKAKALRIFVEPIINRSKDASTNSRRMAFSRLQNKDAVKRLYDEVASAVADRPGGYTRIVKLGQRAGDSAEMAIIELVDFNDVKPEGQAQTTRRTRRSRSRSGGGAGSTEATLTTKNAAPATPTATEAPAEETVTEEAVTVENETPIVEAPATEVDDTAEAIVASAPTPDTTGNPVVVQTPDNPDHGDAEQGGPAGTGEPPPETGMEQQNKGDR